MTSLLETDVDEKTRTKCEFKNDRFVCHSSHFFRFRNCLVFWIPHSLFLDFDVRTRGFVNFTKRVTHISRQPPITDDGMMRTTLFTQRPREAR